METVKVNKLPETGRIPDGKWVAEIRVASHVEARPEDRRTPVNERPLVVPVRWWSQVLGLKAGEASTTLLGERRTTPKDYGYVSIEQDWKLVSDKPFVVVHFRDHNECRKDSPNPHREMTASRQVHKGELGRRPELLRKPRILVSEIPDPDNSYLIPPNLNWVELAELADIMSIEPEDIIRGFAGFSPSTFYEPNVPLLHKMLRREDITRVYVGDVPQIFCGGECLWGGESAIALSSLQRLIDWNGGKVWIPQSFAYQVIRLTQFGYRPENEAPENSFRLEAPMPIPPEPKMPILSAQELRELHPLKMELPKELSQGVFQGLAENALGTDKWQDSKEMDDTSEGFSYYTDFRRLDLDLEGDSITIAICHWTRAGADKSDNYYSGMLAVFPERVADPRRDPSAILRVWFFPDSLQRLTPVGCKGGICPPEVPADLAERVKRFLVSLGYAI